MAWAFATEALFDSLLFSALARMSALRSGNFNAQGLANTTWALANAEHTDLLLFVALAMASDRRIGEFHALDLSNAAWAWALSTPVELAPTLLDPISVLDLIQSQGAPGYPGTKTQVMRYRVSLHSLVTIS